MWPLTTCWDRKIKSMQCMHPCIKYSWKVFWAQLYTLLSPLNKIKRAWLLRCLVCLLPSLFRLRLRSLPGFSLPSLTWDCGSSKLSDCQIVRLSHHCLYPRVAISLPVDHCKSPLTNSSFPDDVKVVPRYLIRHLPELPQLLPGQQLCAHFRAEVLLPPTRQDIHKLCPGSQWDLQGWPAFLPPLLPSTLVAAGHRRMMLATQVRFTMVPG